MYNGEVKLTASIDGQAKTITEASLRRHLKLEDDGGITSLPNTEIFEQLALMGYATDSDKLTFQKELLTSPNSSLMQWRLLQPHTRTYPTPVLTQKVFSNMKRVTRGYSGDDIPLFPSMITAPESSPSRITSSPSLSPQHTPVSAPSTSPPPIPETTPTAEEPAPMPHESPLQSVHSLGRDEGSVLLNELMDLSIAKEVIEASNTGTTRRVTKIVLSEMKLRGGVLPNKGRKEKISDDTEVLLEDKETTELIEEPTELVEDQGSGKKGEQEVTTTDTALNTASVSFSTARNSKLIVINWDDPAVYKVSMALQIDLRSELIHHVSTEKGQYIFMLVEKDYPLTKGLATLMLSNKLRVDQQSEMADELLTKIYNLANKSRKEFLDPKKKKEIESWLGHSRIIDSYDGPNEIEYFDTFPTLEELEYHE
ncbi:hypothetical protein Tco_0750703 [Tanacetum coccineum]|uniref:Uncharacterized protein n=1 Tax=Tanacetum coccineum TaxID=301880 RepID=A0ABQ4Z560_9ASTR